MTCGRTEVRLRFLKEKLALPRKLTMSLNFKKIWQGLTPFETFKILMAVACKVRSEPSQKRQTNDVRKRKTCKTQLHEHLKA